MKITCISDLHSYEPKLPGGDLLIIAGDLTSHDTIPQYMQFGSWIAAQKYEKIVMIAGNHDNLLQNESIFEMSNLTYLCDSGCEFQGLKLWGSPWTRLFLGQNKQCMAFAVATEYQLMDYFSKIPQDTDILITHTPPSNILDRSNNGRVGSLSLMTEVFNRKLKLHVFGHIHQMGCQTVTINDTIYVNAAICDDRYQQRSTIVTLEL